MAHYAWTRILGGKKPVNAGDTVSEGDFEKEDWEYFLDEGIVREEKYPENVATDESPTNAILRQANEKLAQASQPRQPGRASSDK